MPQYAGGLDCGERVGDPGLECITRCCVIASCPPRPCSSADCPTTPTQPKKANKLQFHRNPLSSTTRTSHLSLVGEKKRRGPVLTRGIIPRCDLDCQRFLLLLREYYLLTGLHRWRSPKFVHKVPGGSDHARDTGRWEQWDSM